MRPKIVFNNVSKSFNMYKKQSEKLLEVFSLKREKDRFLAINNLSFVINEGETVGIVGLNGSGKSTLSNLIAEVIPPTSGTIEINGQTSLIAIAAGLNNQLSGMDNIEQKCLMHGMNKKQISEVSSEIIAFADIGKFIDQPVKNYSSGMKSRLGFAISIHTNPDVLIVDEALSVGDQTFYQKCIDKMNQFKREGKTIVFISHSLSQVASFCDRVIWMNYGKMEKFDETKVVLNEYNTFIKWFNALSESEKIDYKHTMLEAQYKENEVSLQVENHNAKINKKNKREKNFFFFQFSLLLFGCVISALYLFGVQPAQSIGKYFANDQVVEQDSIKQNDVRTMKISKQGIVIVDETKLYQDANLQTAISDLTFADELFIEEQMDNAYKVKVNNLVSYVQIDSIKLLTEEMPQSEVRMDAFVPLFPENFADSYMYFFSFLNVESESLKTSLRELTDEETLENGESILKYAGYDAEYTVNTENVAEDLTVTDINLSTFEWDNLKGTASLISEDNNHYFFNTRDYKIVVDATKNAITFTHIN